MVFRKSNAVAQAEAPQSSDKKKGEKKIDSKFMILLVFLLGWIAGAFTMGALPAGDLGLTAIWRSRLLSGLYRVGVFLELLLR